MIDWDLRRLTIPTVIAVWVIAPSSNLPILRMSGKGLCEICLDSAQKTYLSINKDEISCRRNKCVLCGKKARVYPVEIQIPYFSKEIVKNR